jgi:hypothetical protein
MEWKGFPQEPPQTTGNYTVSIKRPKGYGEYIFNDSAYYDSETQSWYKYDPWDDKYEPKEEITNMVIGWIDGVMSYLGTVERRF